MKITEIKVGLGSCGIAAGAQQVYDTLTALEKEHNLPLAVTATG